jgi:tripartite-type tricarboxylate transporter receptor subunit TctC
MKKEALNMKSWGGFGLLAGIALIVMGLILSVSEGIPGEYPRKPITIVIPWPAGADSGVIAQKLANIMNQNKYLPQPMQLLFKPGAAGTIGFAEVLQGKADGYTICFNASAPIIIQPLVKELPYSHKTMIPVIQVVKNDILLVVRNDFPWKGVPEFLGHVKAHPGEVAAGTAGDFTWPHFSLLQLEKFGLKFRHVPFQGNAPATTALLGGHIPVAVLTPGAATPHVAAGKLRFLVSAERDRSSFAPDAPTMKELGYPIPGTTHFYGVIVPKDCPHEVVETLHAAFKKAMDTDEFGAFCKDLGTTRSYIGYKELPEMIDSVVRETAQLLEGIGVKVRKVH